MVSNTFLRSLSVLAAIVSTSLFDSVNAAPVVEKRVPAGVPDYVVKYAPLVHLHSADPFFPSSPATHLTHSVPQINFTTIPSYPQPLTLSNLNALNNLGGDQIYLTSTDDPTVGPAWIKGERPDAAGKTQSVTSVVIINDKGNGDLDAFYMYFYSWNWGGIVELINQNLGNHVGDWEHNMVRFKNGVPQWIWYSQHANGQCFAYNAVQKSGIRPLAFSANGSHAHYALPGPHDHTIPNLNLPLPNGVLVDHTDAGPLYDPIPSSYYYTYNPASDSFTGFDGAPTAFLEFVGKWGDKEYPKTDKRQKDFFGFKKYGGGPTGPRDKQLNRKDCCPDNGNLCIQRRILVPRDS
ncbi:hypothetical protein M501DRAFT_1003604 [Patellaria atrata CBS 101060]|uniref:Vacuolar protein sorting-associated protein 62 n=1 Tax=Patellaria atrata CBS 101060 TaxID=1346257 RepID=A0A9P4VR60_9PEZI|nr:hypothetical protein M501DRAFT_1003604 [Patellaria atrata CBS 101060]